MGQCRIAHSFLLLLAGILLFLSIPNAAADEPITKINGTFYIVNDGNKPHLEGNVGVWLRGLPYSGAMVMVNDFWKLPASGGSSAYYTNSSIPLPAMRLGVPFNVKITIPAIPPAGGSMFFNTSGSISVIANITEPREGSTIILASHPYLAVRWAFSGATPGNTLLHIEDAVTHARVIDTLDVVRVDHVYLRREHFTPGRRYVIVLVTDNEPMKFAGLGSAAVLATPDSIIGCFQICRRYFTAL